MPSGGRRRKPGHARAKHRQGQRHDRRKDHRGGEGQQRSDRGERGLAGALSNVELGDEIPKSSTKAVAEVLIFVLRLSG